MADWAQMSGLAVFYFVDLGKKRFCEFGNGSHIPHDFAFFS